MTAKTGDWLARNARYIEQAARTTGGHLCIDRSGYTLHYAAGSTLSGCRVEPMKTACIAAGLTVIDSRMLDFDMVLDLATRGPLAAVGGPQSSPPPSGPGQAPLSHVVTLYRAAGAEVTNPPPD